MIEDFENGEMVRARIEARDGRMKDYLQQNYSGRAWTGVDVIGED